MWKPKLQRSHSNMVAPSSHCKQSSQMSKSCPPPHTASMNPRQQRCGVIRNDRVSTGTQHTHRGVTQLCPATQRGDALHGVGGAWIIQVPWAVELPVGTVQYSTAQYMATHPRKRRNMVSSRSVKHRWLHIVRHVPSIRACELEAGTEGTVEVVALITAFHRAPNRCATVLANGTRLRHIITTGQY